MEEFIEDFKVESAGILETLQGLLLAYEDSTSKTILAEEIFRGIHTLKGTARMFGFESIEKVTHQLENLLDEYRESGQSFPESFIGLNQKVFDFCLVALEHRETENEVAILLRDIDAFAGSSVANGNTNRSLFCILFTPAADIFERGINVKKIIEELESLGTFSAFLPKKGKTLDRQINNRKLEQTFFDLWLSTSKDRQEVEDVFMFLKDNEYDIIPINEQQRSDEIIRTIETHANHSFSKIERALRADFINAQLYPSGKPELSTTEVISVGVVPEERKTNELDTKLNYINVALPKLDYMMNLVSEFVTLSGKVKHYANLLEADGLRDVAERFERVSTYFRDNAFSMRLVPIQILSVKLQRAVKELGEQLGKKVKFIAEGMETEIDKAIINQIEGPLMHIIRNAIDHGIETAEVRVSKGKPEEAIVKLSAFYSGTNVFIHVQDDGAGINLDRVRAKAIQNGLVRDGETLTMQDTISLIFKPGFSTAEDITEVSGRGVGMDVVKKSIETLRGNIEVTTEKDLGTSFAIRLPLTLSIMDVMIVKVNGANYMIPHSEIETCASERFGDTIQRKGFNIKYREMLLPCLDLASVFGRDHLPGENEKCVLILNKSDQLVAIEVDEVIGKEQVVVKPVGESLQTVSYLSGTSILGNGDLAFLLDVLKLKQLYARKV